MKRVLCTSVVMVALIASGANAGNLVAPKMEPAVAVAAAKQTSSSSAMVVPLILLGIVVLALVSTTSKTVSPPLG